MDESNRLFFIREKLDLTQKDMARQLNISRAYYSLCELNLKFMPLTLLNSFCNLYDTTIDYIYYLSKSNNIKHIIKIGEINKNDVGQRLQEIFNENKLTQKQVANFLNTSQSTISAYIHGKTMILTSFALQLSKKYDFSLDWLIGRSNVKNID